MADESLTKDPGALWEMQDSACLSCDGEKIISDRLKQRNAVGLSQYWDSDQLWFSSGSGLAQLWSRCEPDSEQTPNSNKQQELFQMQRFIENI